MTEHARKRDRESIARNRERVGDLQAIAGDGTFDERVHNLARYYERVLWGPPKPVRKWRRAARPPRENVIRFRRRVEPPPPKHHRGRKPHPRVTGWWLRCETCRRYVGRDGSCIHCDNPS